MFSKSDSVFPLFGFVHNCVTRKKTQLWPVSIPNFFFDRILVNFFWQDSCQLFFDKILVNFFFFFFFLTGFLSILLFLTGFLSILLFWQDSYHFPRWKRRQRKVAEQAQNIIRLRQVDNLHRSIRTLETYFNYFWYVRIKGGCWTPYSMFPNWTLILSHSITIHSLYVKYHFYILHIDWL